MNPPKMAARMFIGRTATLLSGTVLAQAITFGLSFIISRLYVPAEFGRYAVFAGLAGVLGAASTGALESVIVLARSDGEARRVGSAAIMTSVASALLVGLLGLGAILIGPLAMGSAEAAALGPWELGLLLPIFVASYGVTQVFVCSNLRANRLKTVAGFKVAQSVVTGSVQVASSALLALPGLTIGMVAGWMVIGGAGARAHFSSAAALRDLRFRTVKFVMRRHWRFPSYVMPNQLIDNLSGNAPIFLIGAFSSLSAAGHYGLAVMMLSAPAALVGQAVGQVFLQHIGRHEGERPALVQAMHRVWLAMALLGTGPFLLIGMFGPGLFGLGFGPEWVQAGIVAQILSPLLFVRFVSSTTSSIYLKLGMQREQMWFVLAAVVYRPFAYGLGAFGIGLEIQIMVHVVAEVVAIVGYNALALRKLRATPPEIHGSPT